MCVCVCVCVCVRTFKIYSLSNFQVYNTLLLTIVTMLYIRSSELIHLITRSLYPLTNISPFPTTPSPLATTILLSVYMNLFFLDFTCKWDYTLFIFLCLMYSISIMSSSFICVVTNDRISFFLFMAEAVLFIWSFLAGWISFCKAEVNLRPFES